MDVPNSRRRPTSWWIGPVMFLIIMLTIILSLPPAINEKQDLILTNCPSTVGERISAADVVTSGTVFAVLPGGTAGAQVIISPETIFKGTVERSTLIINAKDVQGPAGGDPIDSIEIQFKSGQPPYLLYLRRRGDGTYDTRACDGSRFLGTGLTPTEELALQQYAPT